MKKIFSVLFYAFVICFLFNNLSFADDEQLIHVELMCVPTDVFTEFDSVVDLDSGNNTFEGTGSYFSGGNVYIRLTGQWDNNFNISGDINYYANPDYTSWFRTDSFSGVFDKNNQLYSIADTTTNNPNTGCDTAVRLSMKKSSFSLLNGAPAAEIQSATGQSFSITPVEAEILTSSSTISDIGALLTLEDSSSTIIRDDGSVLEVKQQSVVTLNPESITLIRGEVTATVGCHFKVITALAEITSCPTTQKSADAATFTTNYSSDGLNGTLTISVETGTVDVKDRNGKVFTLTAGQEKTIYNQVFRTSWVMPIDDDKLYGGENNFLVWTKYPEAATYMMELNLPNPVFSEENASTPEFLKQAIPLPDASYIEFEGLILLMIPLPRGADGIVIEMRIFALDAAGNIIGESVSSDSTKVTVVD